MKKVTKTNISLLAREYRGIVNRINTVYGNSIRGGKDSISKVTNRA